MGKVLLGIMGISLLFSAYYAIGIVLLVIFLPFAAISDIKRHYLFKRRAEVHAMFQRDEITMRQLMEIHEKEGLDNVNI